MNVSKLLARLQLPTSHRMVCQAPECNRPIHADVHLICDAAGGIHVVGSTCYDRLTGSAEATAAGARYGWDGRRLTPEERDELLANTVAFIERMEMAYATEREAVHRAAEAARAKVEQQRQEGLRALAASGGFLGHRPAPPRGSDSQLARYRAQQARIAANGAMARVPALRQYDANEVADAMVRAKAQYLAQGGSLDTDGSRAAIEQAALAILNGHPPRS